MTTLAETTVRLEDRPLITGAGRYVGDLVDGETLHCVFVRSIVAHGLLGPPDLGGVTTMPGVVAAFDADGLGLPDMPSSPGRGAPPATGMGQPPLARGRVRYVGEPIAVIVAESPAQAMDAADLVWADIEPLDAVTPVTAPTDDVLLFPETGSNLVHEAVVGTDGPRPDVEVETTVEIDIPRVSPLTIEPLAILVRPDGPGLEVWCGHQAPARLPHQLGSMLGLDPDLIRARVPEVGGAFGTKAQYYPEYPVVAAVAHRLGRPAVWLQRRREQLMCGTHGRGQRVTMRIGGDRSGDIRFVHADLVGDIGAYPSTGSRIPFFSISVIQGAYDIEHLEARGRIYVTNRAPTGPYRGAGRPEAAMSIERAVDAFAEAVGLAPEEVRRRNFVAPSAFPYTSQTGTIYDSGDYAGALDLALETADVTAWRERQTERRQTGGDPIGIGIASYVERAGGAVGSGERGGVELLDDGTVVVRTGSTAAGQGHRTVWSQIAAGVLSVPVDRVRFIAGDTREVAGVGSFSSRSTQLGGSAILETARQVRDQAAEVAARMLEAAEADLELAGGRFRVLGSPGAEVTLEQVAAHAAEAGVELAAEEMFIGEALTVPYGTFVAVVEVIRATGEVRLLSLVAVDDYGNVLNPMIVEGQLQGSAMQGLGQSLLEQVVYDDEGQLQSANLVSYLIPTAGQAFPLTSRRTSTPAPGNPLGVKGAGEAGCIGVPAAMLNAIHDALRDDGVTSIDLPLTAGRVWEAIRQADTERNSRR